MALPSTLHRFEIDISDVDRGVYERVEFRLARHPSETVSYALVRVIAFALEYREDLVWGPGLCQADEPALSVPDSYGGIDVWLDIGAPSADRLHKASKRAEHVVVYTHRERDHLRREWSSRAIHKAEEIRVVGVPAGLLGDLEATFGRGNAWGLLRTEGVVYVTVAGETYSGSIEEYRVGEPSN